jgi:hypothetical protein
MASYQVKVDLIFGEKGIVRGALNSLLVRTVLDCFNIAVVFYFVWGRRTQGCSALLI